jgi:hypothetical protein
MNNNNEIKKKKHVFDRKFEKSLLTRLFGLSTGVFIVSFVIWSRLIVERLPRETLGEMFSLSYWITLYFFLIYLVTVTLSIYHAYKQYKNITEVNRHLAWLNEYITKTRLWPILKFNLFYIVRAPEFMFLWVIRNTKYSIIKQIDRIIFEPFFKVICNKFSYYGVEIVLLFNYLPRIIVTIILFYEIVVNKRIDFFYYFAWMLLIPVLYKTLHLYWSEMILKYIIYETTQIYIVPQNLLYNLENIQIFPGRCTVRVSQRVKAYCQKITIEFQRFNLNIEKFSENYIYEHWKFVDYSWRARKIDPSMMCDTEFGMHISNFDKYCEMYSINLDFNLVRSELDTTIMPLIYFLLMLSFLIWLLTTCGIY